MIFRKLFFIQIIILSSLVLVACEGKKTIDSSKENARNESEAFTQLFSSQEELESINGVLVKFNTSVSLFDQQRLLQDASLNQVFRSTLISGLVYAEPADLSAMSISSSIDTLLDSKDDVVYAEPDFPIYLNSQTEKAVPNKVQIDSALSSRDLNLNNEDPHVVAVLDTGVLFNAPQLSNNIWLNTGEIPLNGIDDDGNGWVDDIKGWNFVEGDNNPLDFHQHGTQIAGIISGTSGLEATKVDSLKILPLRVLDENGRGNVSNVIRAFEYIVANKIVLSNNSWGLRFDSRALFDTLQALNNFDHLAIVAAGNSGQNVDNTPFYPIQYKMNNILSVGSIDSENNLSVFSNFGPESIQLVAPGENIVNTIIEEGASEFSGTSMSAAYITNIAAQLKITDHDVTGQELKQLVLNSADTNANLDDKVVANKYIASKETFFSNLSELSIPNVEATLTLTADSIDLAIGEKTQLTVTGGNAPYTWEIKNSLFATINEENILTALTQGNTGVSVTDANGEISNEIVINISPMSITTENTENYTIGKVYEFSAKGGVPPFTWNIDDTGIATGETLENDTSKFQITPVSGGEFNITLIDSTGLDSIIGPLFVTPAPLVVSPAALKLTLQQEAQLSAEGGNSSYIWTSSDDSIITVNDTGLVTALNSGNANIIVTDSANSSQTIAVTVLDELTIIGETFLLAPGAITKLEVTGGDSSESFVWASSDSSIIEVNKTDGTVTAVAPGSAKIVVVNGVMSGSVTLTVREINISSLSSVFEVSPSINKFQVDGGNAPYTWSVNDSGIASINNDGEFIALSAGNVVVTATDSDNFSASITITVEPAPLSISHSNAVLAKDSGLQLILNGGDGNYTWESSDDQVVTVDAFGFVTAIDAGAAVVTVTDGLGDSLFVVVNVRLVGINIDSTEIKISEPNQQLSATGGRAPYSWSVDDTSLATIDENGLLTALGLGTVTVSVIDANFIPAEIEINVTADVLNASLVNDIIGIQNATQILATGGYGGLTYSSSDTNIVEIDLVTGEITGISAGNTFVSVTDELFQTVTLAIEVREVSLATENNVASSLTVGDPALTLIAIGGQAPYRWSSSDSAILTVSDTGLAVAQTSGNATITVTDNGGFSDSLSISVLSSPLNIVQNDQILSINGTQQLNASGGDNQYNWSSSNNAVVSVSINGFITANSAGNATVTVTDGEGSTASIEIEIREISISGVSALLSLGQNNVSYTASGGAGGYTWKSNNEAVLTIDASGAVNTINVGTAEITATDSNGFSGSILLTVEAVPIIVTDSNIILGKDDSFSIGATGGNGNLTWSSDSIAVATVDGVGNVTAQGIGSATITVTDDFNQSVNILVEVREVTLNTSTNNLNILSSTLQISASGGQGSYSWSVDDPSIATVNNNGLLTAVSEGSVIVTATDADGISGSITISLFYPAMDINNTSLLLGISETAQLIATGGDENYTWSSSNSSIVSVNTNGNVTANGTGTANITVSDGAGNSLTVSIEVRNVNVTSSTTSLNVGDNVSLSANGGSVPFSWTSNNTLIATVNNNGTVTAVSPGTVTITAVDSDGFSDSITLTISFLELSLNSNSVLLGVNNTFQLIATGGNSNYTFSSSNSAIASVNSNGLVTANSIGTAIITLRDGLNNTRSATIEVRQVSLSGATSVTVGSTITLNATGGGSSYTWSSSNNNIASVNNSGVVTGESGGSVNITATDSDGFAGSMSVTVNFPSLVLNGGSALLGINGTHQLSASGGDSNYTFSSSNNSVASVNSNGLVTANGAGTAIITLRDGLNNTRSASIEVRQVSLSGATSVTVGSTITLNAVGGGSSFTWSTSNNNIASVNNSGVVTGQSGGSVTITATDSDGFSGSMTVTVNFPSLVLSGGSALLGIGDTHQLSASGGDGNYSFTSSNNSVAIVNDNGRVTGNGVGTSTITLRDGNNNTRTVSVEVRQLTISGATSVNVGSSILLSTSGGGGSINWSSSNTGIATVNGGIVTGQAAGTVTITATDSDGFSDTISITVNSVFGGGGGGGGGH